LALAFQAQLNGQVERRARRAEGLPEDMEASDAWEKPPPRNQTRTAQFLGTCRQSAICLAKRLSRGAGECPRDCVLKFCDDCEQSRKARRGSSSHPVDTPASRILAKILYTIRAAVQTTHVETRPAFATINTIQGRWQARRFARSVRGPEPPARTRRRFATSDLIANSTSVDPKRAAQTPFSTKVIFRPRKACAGLRSDYPTRRTTRAKGKSDSCPIQPRLH
jgi:hypothetical protein